MYGRVYGVWCICSDILGYNQIRKVNIRLPEKANSNSRGARLVHYNHLDDQVDSDQKIANKEISFSRKMQVC